MYPTEPLALCHRCDITHYENCPTCWGFGVYASHDTRLRLVPVSGAMAAGSEPLPPSARACPTCRSTPLGVPIEPTAPTPGFWARNLPAIVAFAIMYLLGDLLWRALVKWGLDLPGAGR